MNGPESIHTIQPVVNNAKDQSKEMSYPGGATYTLISLCKSDLSEPKMEVAIKPNKAVKIEKAKPNNGEPRPKKPTAIMAARANPLVKIEINTNPRVVLNFAHSASLVKSAVLLPELMQCESRLKSTHAVTPVL